MVGEMTALAQACNRLPHKGIRESLYGLGRGQFLEKRQGSRSVRLRERGVGLMHAA